jgi:hypothetical protein
VTTAANRQRQAVVGGGTHSVRHVLGIGAPDDACGPPVDGAVPDLAGSVVFKIARHQQAAA